MLDDLVRARLQELSDWENDAPSIIVSVLPESAFVPHAHAELPPLPPVQMVLPSSISSTVSSSSPARSSLSKRVHSQLQVADESKDDDILTDISKAGLSSHLDQSRFTHSN